jgi:hypothetical protein
VPSCKTACTAGICSEVDNVALFLSSCLLTTMTQKERQGELRYEKLCWINGIGKSLASSGPETLSIVF